MTSWEEVVLSCWEQGQAISAVGPGPVSAHLAHARALAGHLGPDEVVGVDLGSGVGLPGLALAGLRPDMRWTLVDASRRRVQVVGSAVSALGWQDRVATVHGRAEDVEAIGHRAADVVVARLFGPPATTAECAAPLVRRGGRVLITEPPEGEERWPDDPLVPLGLARGRRLEDPHVQELLAVGDPEARFPRKPGVAAKRPLW